MSEIKEIEKEVDNINLPQAQHKQRMKFNRTAKILFAGLMTSLLVLGAYAGLLPWFGEIHTTINVEGSIIIGEKTDPQSSIIWKAWNDPIERNIDPTVNTTDYCYKAWIKNQAHKDLLLNIIDTGVTAPGTPMDFTGVTITHHVFGDTQTMKLVWKDATWKQTNPTSYATVTFRTCNETFDYKIDYHNITGSYSLIYYFDTDPDRYTDYGHCLVLANIIFTGTGTTTGQTDIPTIPYKTDVNADNSKENYTTSDGYKHANGAKIWLVPQTSLTNPTVGKENQLIGFDQTLYLFETDLVLYLDCNDLHPYCLPDVFPLFDTMIAKAGQTYCWITCYHIDPNITPGTYEWSTKVYASSII